MNERTLLLVLATGTAVSVAGLLIWFLRGIRPRSIAYRSSGAALSVLVLLVAGLIVVPLESASLAHAAAESEVGTFAYGMLAEIVIFVASILLIAAGVLWRIGIQRHPDPVSKLEQATQIGLLILPLGFYLLRVAW